MNVTPTFSSGYDDDYWKCHRNTAAGDLVLVGGNRLADVQIVGVPGYGKVLVDGDQPVDDDQPVGNRCADVQPADVQPADDHHDDVPVVDVDGHIHLGFHIRVVGSPSIQRSR